ncbi:hypothetical protein V6N11_070102 [Hibiscus sabdariffa]|uniref:Reverse transcriptase zinc-binding domain-containing protein n=1 Tax=Hibiscus sabdariffa TaxID=183260 RepID=A0ABR2QE18_9ROSI
MGHGGGESGFMQGCGSRFAVLETDKRGVKSKGSWASQVPRRIWKGRELWRLWKIVHNLLTRFEYHQWLDTGDRLTLNYTRNGGPRPIMVSDMLHPSGDWDWNRIKALLPLDTVERIVAVSPPRANYGTDLPGWRWEINRRFSVASAYNFLVSNEDRHCDNRWRVVWSLRVPQRIRIFLWITCHGRHLTNVERVRRHMAMSEECNICHDGIEIWITFLDVVIRRESYEKRWCQ